LANSPSYMLFNEYAGRYEEWYHRHKLEAENEARLVEALVGPPPRVEIGGGTGFFAARVSALVVEPAHQMAILAKLRGLDVVEAVAEALPLRTCSTGTALIIVTLCFLEDPVTAISEAYRILRFGGRLVTCIVPRRSSWGMFYTDLGDKGHVFYSVARFYTVSEVERLIADAGFRVLGVGATLSYPPWEQGSFEEPQLGLSPDEAENYGFACVVAEKDEPRETRCSLGRGASP